MATVKDTEWFNQKVFELVGNEYSVLEPYKNTRTKILMKHNLCGTEFSVNPNHFVSQGNRCPNWLCVLEKKNSTFDSSYREKNHSDEFSILSHAKDKSPMTVLHLNCNKVFSVTASAFRQNKNCPHCKPPRNKKRCNEEIQKLITEKLDASYHLVSDYKDIREKISVLHRECGNVWDVLVTNIQNGNRCPYCGMRSKGEEAVIQFLTDNKIDFIQQYKNRNCKRKHLLPFDFKIKNKNILIEYDGEFHFLPISGIEKLKCQQKNDLIKTNFARDSGFRLIRIPYTEFKNIDEILTKELL